MKRCPYCAEEVQDEAIICRYCFRRIRGRYNRIIVIVIAASLLLFFTERHKRDISGFMYRAKMFFRDVCVLVNSIPEGVKAVSDINKRTEYANQVINDGSTLHEKK